MTPTQGEHAQTEAQPIQRFEVVDCIDSKHVPAVIPRKDGPWVRYEDHAAQVAALTAAPGVKADLRQILLDPENQPNQYGVQFLMRGPKMAFRIGGRQFALDYEPDEPGEFEFMRDALIDAFSVFTHDVKTAPQPTPTAQAAPAAGITVEQVEDAIGLQSTAWDTIGAEKIVEAVLRLANAKAPAAGAVAGMPPGISALMCVISSLRDTAHFSDEAGELTDELRTLRDWAMTQAAAPTPAAQADSVLEDAARLDWLDQNIFHREMSQWDKALGGWEGHNMWVMFAPKGAQGSARNILDAARKQGAKHD